MIKGIIFDLDGVLLSTDDFHYVAWSAIAKELGIRFTRFDYNEMLGLNRRDSLEWMLKLTEEKYSEDQKQYLCDKKNQLYLEQINDIDASFVSYDVRRTLSELKSDGYKLGLASSSRNARRIIAVTKLDNYFEVVCDGNDIIKPKPNPEVFIKVADKLGLNYKDCLVVEDGIPGIIAAKKGGFISVGIGYALDHEQTDYPISKLSDIFNILKEEN